MYRILVVDDDSSVSGAIETLLHSEGYDVVVVDSGRAGLTALEEQRFDVVLVDIFMPGMDGFDALKTIKALAPDVPVVAMSGFRFREASAAAPDFLTMASKLGAAYSLRKPFRPRDLLAIVEACVARQTASATSRLTSAS